VLEALTHLGDTETIVGVAIAVGAFGLWRWRRPAVPSFLLSVVLGQMLISNTIKAVIDRARPELRPRAEFTGTSFPSGHTTAATATYLAVTLVLAIGGSSRARAALAGAALAIGVAVGCTRVLGVHFFTNALAGFAIGLSWFGLCAVAFGGRLLSFGAPPKVAASRPCARPRSAPVSAPDAILGVGRNAQVCPPSSTGRPTSSNQSCQTRIVRVRASAVEAWHPLDTRGSRHPEHLLAAVRSCRRCLGASSRPRSLSLPFAP
jgi:undecaprenyl-diphosphatase